MKEIIKDVVNGVMLGGLFTATVLIVATCSNNAYSKDLSKLTSVTPQRHCGFIVPKFCIGSQSMREIYGSSVSATHTRLYTLYEGMTRQNTALPNMSGGSSKPRVSPLTSIFTGEYLKNSKLLGGNHA